jgi:carotenoid cleavage dioxygenase
VAAELPRTDLTVEGDLPRELAGTLARNSGNPQFDPPGRYHWFDGDGMVHALTFDDGQVSYRNRWIRTEAFAREAEAGRALWPGILEPTDPSLRPPIKDTANTDLIAFGGGLLATWWLSGTPMALSLPELETRGPVDFGGKLPRQGMAAHPKVCPRTGELLFFGYSLLRRPYYAYGVASAEGELVHAVDLDFPRPHVPHDIAITERYTLLLDLPLGYDPAALAQGKKRIGFAHDVPGRIGVIPRRGGADDVRWFEVPACYVYHTVNAYEDGDEVVLTACRIEDPIPRAGEAPAGTARLDSILLVPHLYRWRLNMTTGEARGEALDDRATEFPRIDDRRQGSPARYGYHQRIAARDDLSFDGIVKYDLVEGRSWTHDYQPGWFGGESVFAPRPGGTEEDDGWVLTVVTHPDEVRSRLLVLDAGDLGAAPLAQVELPQRIPPGFHAEWAPAR